MRISKYLSVRFKLPPCRYAAGPLRDEGFGIVPSSGGPETLFSE